MYGGVCVERNDVNWQTIVEGIKAMSRSQGLPTEVDKAGALQVAWIRKALLPSNDTLGVASEDSLPVLNSRGQTQDR